MERKSAHGRGVGRNKRQWADGVTIGEGPSDSVRTGAQRKGEPTTR